MIFGLFMVDFFDLFLTFQFDFFLKIKLFQLTFFDFLLNHGFWPYHMKVFYNTSLLLRQGAPN